MRTPESRTGSAACLRYYVIASRDEFAQNPRMETVVCVPVYGRFLGLDTEVPLGAAHGLPRDSAARCDLVTNVFKSKLVRRVGRLDEEALAELRDSLLIALDLA
jgi:mRNA interferase MazF